MKITEGKGTDSEAWPKIEDDCAHGSALAAAPRSLQHLITSMTMAIPTRGSYPDSDCDCDWDEYGITKAPFTIANWTEEENWLIVWLMDLNRQRLEFWWLCVSSGKTLSTRSVDHKKSPHYFLSSFQSLNLSLILNLPRFVSPIIHSIWSPGLGCSQKSKSQIELPNQIVEPHKLKIFELSKSVI